MAVSDTSANEVSERPVVLNLLLSTRPGQWTKNLLVFAGVLFGRKLFDPRAVADAFAAFAIFCALSGAVYLFNDIADRDADRQHPLKRRRPIASGAVPLKLAGGAAALLGAVGEQHDLVTPLRERDEQRQQNGADDEPMADFDVHRDRAADRAQHEADGDRQHVEDDDVLEDL